MDQNTEDVLPFSHSDMQLELQKQQALLNIPKKLCALLARVLSPSCLRAANMQDKSTDRQSIKLSKSIDKKVQGQSEKLPTRHFDNSGFLGEAGWLV